jgi:hypothetical protein
MLRTKNMELFKDCSVKFRPLTEYLGCFLYFLRNGPDHKLHFLQCAPGKERERERERDRERERETERERERERERKKEREGEQDRPNRSSCKLCVRPSEAQSGRRRWRRRLRLTLSVRSL